MVGTSALESDTRCDASTVTSPYTPVDASINEIRLLKLAPGGFDDPIQVRLEKACLDDEPSYDAVSYVWEKDIHHGPAIVNDSVLDITSNLDCALRHFRDMLDEKVLWVDAICINQKDDLEKGAQVQLMAQVFSKAHEVLIRLGPATTDATDELLTTSHQLYSNRRISIPYTSQLYPAVKEIMDRPWFTRIWVGQAFILATRPYVCCRWQRTPWDMLVKTMFTLLQSIIWTGLYCRIEGEPRNYNSKLKTLDYMRHDVRNSAGNFAVQLEST